MNYPNKKKVIIACASIRPELEKHGQGLEGVGLFFMDQGLHRVPQKMPVILQDIIDKVAQGDKVEHIILGYGLCSNGVVGLEAPLQGLLIPKAHDCIAFFLGSKEAHEKHFNKYPGTYYLTKSWIDNQKDPLGLMINEYTERVGREDAEWAIKEETKNYSHIAFINTLKEGAGPYRERAKENARYFNKNYQELEGSSDFIMKMLHGPYNSKHFVEIPRGQEVRQKYFMK